MNLLKDKYFKFILIILISFHSNAQSELLNTFYPELELKLSNSRSTERFYCETYVVINDSLLDSLNIVYFNYGDIMLNTEKKGIFHGKLFRLDGKMRILESAQYSNGLLMSSILLDTLGSIVQLDSGYFLNNEYLSISKEFYSNQGLKKIIRYQDMARINEEWFHSTGYKEKEITHTYFPGGVEINIQEFYPTGQIKVKSGYNYETYDGKYIEYYKSGKIKVTGEHFKGEKRGRWIHYRPNGKVKFTSTYPEEIIIKEY